MSECAEAEKSKEGGDEKKSEPPCERVPGFCSATCVNKACMREVNKRPFPKTSEVYATCNLPKRFDNPLLGLQSTQLMRVLKTQTVVWLCATHKLFPAGVLQLSTDWFNGYGSQVNKEHPLYRTSASEYGWYPPGIHSVPSVHFPLTQHFTETMYATGMYRNYSLNMSAPDPPTKMC